MFDIIIPTYKTPINLLKSCLDSVENQTFKDYTVWICDGTPHDWGRYDAMEKLFSKYPNFNTIRQTGKGVSQARNQIIRLGNEPYVAFLDSDDEWFENHLEIMANAIAETDDLETKVWFGELREKHTRNYLLGLQTVQIPEKIGLQVRGELRIQCYGVVNFLPTKYHAHFHSSSPIWFSAMVMDRKAMEMTELFEESLTIGEDTMLLLHVLSNGYRTHHIHFEAGIRNQHDGQLTATVSDEHNTELGDYMLIHFPNLKTDVETAEDLTYAQKKSILEYMVTGRSRGITNSNCPIVYNIMSLEDYEIESL